MLEHSTAHILNYIIVTLCSIFLIGLLMFSIQLTSVNNFKQDVSYEVERASTIDAALKNRINKISKDKYKNQFTVNFPVESASKKYTYGSEVNYTIDVKIKLIVKSLPEFKTTATGSAVKRTR